MTEIEPELILDANPGIGLGLILLDCNGVLYTSQCGGYACLHKQARGFYMPVNDQPRDPLWALNGFPPHKGECNTTAQVSALYDFFYGDSGPWKGSCYTGIDPETADFVDEVLSRLPETSWIEVDRTRLTDSCEAWIYVKLPETKFKTNEVVREFGVLLWNNSD